MGHYFWHILWHSIWHSFRQRYSDIISDILSGILLTYVLTFCLTSMLTFYLACFLSGPLHQDLPIWSSGPGMVHCIWSSPYGSDPFMPTISTSWQKEEVEEEEWVAPLLKSRDPHLAGGKEWIESTQKEYLTWFSKNVILSTTSCFCWEYFLGYWFPLAKWHRFLTRKCGGQP